MYSCSTYLILRRGITRARRCKPLEALGDGCGGGGHSQAWLWRGAARGGQCMVRNCRAWRSPWSALGLCGLSFPSSEGVALAEGKTTMAMAGEGEKTDDLYVMQANLNNAISKIMEMENQIESQEQEVSRLEMVVNESERFQDLEYELERSSGLEVVSVSDDYLEMRITTYVPAMQTIIPNYKGKYEHELAIKLDTTTMTIEAVQLMPEDVPYEDLVADARALSALHEAPLLVVGGQGWSKQILSLIAKIRYRIYANVLRNVTISTSAKDPRYKLKFLPEANLVIATLPGPITANIATPHGWPMPGFSLHLNSLVPSAKGRDLELSGILQQCVDLANSSPESRRSDILQFLQTIEKIYISKRKEASNYQ